MTIMFTGFPGFIATQIMIELLKNEENLVFVALIKDTEMKTALERKTMITKRFPQATIELVEGDITLPNLDLVDGKVEELQNTVTTFWHLAAIYDLAVPKDLAWKVNVHGTNTVNEFVKGIQNLQRYMYFSTAYVAGKRTGNLLETELIRPEQFKNFYEETKFAAELLVEDLKAEVPTTIIRPGIVRGHSITGETIKFDGPYFLLNMVSKLRALPFIPYIGHSTSTLNTVPVDYIFQAAVYLSQAEEAVSKTVHLTDPNPHPIQEIVRAVTIEMTGKSPKGHLPLKMTQKIMKNKKLQRYLQVEQESLDYFSWDATFDTTIAKQLLQKAEIDCPDFIATLPEMVSFYEKNKNKKEFHVKI